MNVLVGEPSRYVRNVEVGGSSPITSTTVFNDQLPKYLERLPRVYDDIEALVEKP